MRSNYSDAYPYPTAGERRHVMDELLNTFDDELWEYMTETTDADLDPPARPAIQVHNHQLCGHDCLSGACSGLEAICISCEFRLQDSRGHDSPFRKPRSG